MKATKKIVGAACALVAAVALSAGSTFAWFSSNDHVDVTGMKVKAKVPENLYIVSGLTDQINTIVKTSLSYNETTAQVLNPARLEGDTATPTKIDVKKPQNYTKEPDGGNAGEVDTENGGTYTTVGSFDLTVGAGAYKPVTDGDTEKYVALYPMTLLRAKQGGDPCKLDATVTISFAKTITDLSKDKTWQFVRVGFFSEGRFISLANDKASIDEAPADAPAESTAGKRVVFNFSGVEAASGEGGTSTPLSVLTAMEGNKAYKIQFAVWFDGDDGDCYVNNALETHDMDITIEYSIPVAE